MDRTGTRPSQTGRKRAIVADNSIVNLHATLFLGGAGFWMLGIVALVWVMQNFTRMGLYIYAIGGNLQAAIVSGVRAKTYLILAYALCGMLASVSGLALTAQIGSGQAVINAQPFVQMSRVRARRSPITGALVAAEVVLAPTERPQDAEITGRIREACRRALAPHKVPAVIQIVPSLPLSGNGKLVRNDA